MINLTNDYVFYIALNSDPPVVCSDDSVSSHSSTGGHLYRSRSNPDLSTTEYEENGKSEFPDHVLKVGVTNNLNVFTFQSIV